MKVNRHRESECSATESQRTYIPQSCSTISGPLKEVPAFVLEMEDGSKAKAEHGEGSFASPRLTFTSENCFLERGAEERAVAWLQVWLLFSGVLIIAIWERDLCGVDLDADQILSEC